MNRLSVFNSYKTHSWFKKLYSKLSKSDLDFAVQFLLKHDLLDKSGFHIEVTNLFLDTDKPKNHLLITELLMSCNSKL